MSNITGLAPLDIPLKADPGHPPLLAEGWGHISMSHCSDALLIVVNAAKGIGVPGPNMAETPESYKKL